MGDCIVKEREKIERERRANSSSMPRLRNYLWKLAVILTLDKNQNKYINMLSFQENWVSLSFN